MNDQISSLADPGVKRGTCPLFHVFANGNKLLLPYVFLDLMIFFVISFGREVMTFLFLKRAQNDSSAPPPSPAKNPGSAAEVNAYQGH